MYSFNYVIYTTKRDILNPSTLLNEICDSLHLVVNIDNNAKKGYCLMPLYE